MDQEHDNAKLDDKMIHVIELIMQDPQLKTIVDLVSNSIRLYPDKFNDQDLIDLSIDLSSRFLSPRIDDPVHNEKIINEYAKYINLYLKGDLRETEEDTKKNLQPQIDTSQKVIGLTCKNERMN